MKTLDGVDLFIQSRQSRGLAQNTIKWYRMTLSIFADYYPKLPKRPEQIEKFLISRNIGDERRHAYYRALKCFYRFLVRRKIFRHNPIEQLEEPRRTVKDPPYLMPEKLNQILSAAMDPKIKTAILAYIDTGARLSEICGLTVDNLLETPDGFVALVDGKTGQRPVPISYETYHALMVNLPFGCTASWLYRRIKSVCLAAGVDATPLTFRHTFGTLWAGDELILQQIMGHSTIATTKRYRHLRTTALIQQHNQYSPLRMVHSASRSLF